MAKSITLNTGEKIEIRNTDGDLMGYFYFNPADPDIMRRCEEAQKKIEEISNQIEKEISVDELEKVNNILREQMTYILGDSAGAVLFKYNSPLAVMQDGQLYGVYAFNIIFEFIKSEISARIEKSRKVAEQYTAKYE